MIEIESTQGGLLIMKYTGSPVAQVDLLANVFAKWREIEPTVEIVPMAVSEVKKLARNCLSPRDRQKRRTMLAMVYRKRHAR